MCSPQPHQPAHPVQKDAKMQRHVEITTHDSAASSATAVGWAALARKSPASPPLTHALAWHQSLDIAWPDFSKHMLAAPLRLGTGTTGTVLRSHLSMEASLHGVIASVALASPFPSLGRLRKSDFPTAIYLGRLRVLRKRVVRRHIISDRVE